MLSDMDWSFKIANPVRVAISDFANETSNVSDWSTTAWTVVGAVAAIVVVGSLLLPPRHR